MMLLLILISLEKKNIYQKHKLLELHNLLLLFLKVNIFQEKGNQEKQIQHLNINYQDFMIQKHQMIGYISIKIYQILVHLIPSELPEGIEPEAYQKQIENADPFENRLKPISNDKNAWKIRIVGDTTDYNPLSKDTNNKVNNGVIIIKSLVWPGLVTVYSNKVLSQLYYGYGYKATNNHFYPKQPQQVQSEQPDLPEQPEPNFPAEVPQQPQD
ncbi:unnamed protein product [Paramecium primaurelia]|uniref:Uncharacterized protein n=1 Tax=Paramecium primaurelia TaxID=5886 RepID=A0A8S1N9R0_PARPR|nr:unnamed protein product [Paramecium primaurelia]